MCRASKAHTRGNARIERLQTNDQQNAAQKDAEDAEDAEEPNDADTLYNPPRPDDLTVGVTIKLPGASDTTTIENPMEEPESHEPEIKPATTQEGQAAQAEDD